MIVRMSPIDILVDGIELSYEAREPHQRFTSNDAYLNAMLPWLSSKRDISQKGRRDIPIKSGQYGTRGELLVHAPAP